MYDPSQYIVSPDVSLALESTFLCPPTSFSAVLPSLLFWRNVLSFFSLLVYLTGIVAGNSQGPCPLVTVREGPVWD